MVTESVKAVPSYVSALGKMSVRADHGTTTDAVTDVLREAILSGVLTPPTWLREDELASALKVSRTPVREALRRLTDEGLTQRVANRGTVVTSMTLDEVLAVYAVREALEGLAARSAANRVSPKLLEALQMVQSKMIDAVGDTTETAVLNLEFHRLIREASGNSYLMRFLAQVEHAVRRFGQSTYAIPGRGEDAVTEHQGIIDAIAVGNADLAEELATQHMRKARESRVRQIMNF